MSDRIVWSSRMTQDYAKGLSDEEKRNFLIDRGYDAEMLDGADLDEIIEQDDYMWQDDVEDFDRTIVPMINRQTYNGIVLAIDKDKDRIVAMPAEDLIAGDIASDANGMQLVDEGGLVAKYYFNDIPSDTLELYAIPEGETEQQDFIQDVMQGYADSLRSDSDEEVMPVDIAGALSDPDVLEDWVDKDALRKVGIRIKADLSESLDECGNLQFPKEELEEEVTSGIGFENAKRFAEYLNDNEGQNGYFGDEEIVSKGDSVHLYSPVSDMTFTFTDDEGVVVEGQDEEEGTYEEYFDTVDDFVKWYQSMAFTFSSDLGAELGKYLAGGEVEESCEEVKEGCDESLNEDEDLGYIDRGQYGELATDKKLENAFVPGAIMYIKLGEDGEQVTTYAYEFIDWDPESNRIMMWRPLNDATKSFEREMNADMGAEESSYDEKNNIAYIDHDGLLDYSFYIVTPDGEEIVYNEDDDEETEYTNSNAGNSKNEPGRQLAPVTNKQEAEKVIKEYFKHYDGIDIKDIKVITKYKGVPIFEFVALEPKSEERLFAFALSLGSSASDLSDYRVFPNYPEIHGESKALNDLKARVDSFLPKVKEGLGATPANRSNSFGATFRVNESCEKVKKACDESCSKKDKLNEKFSNWTEAYKLFTACADRFYPDEDKIREAAEQVYEVFEGDPQVEEAWKR